jgi:hypothetical protein
MTNQEPKTPPAPDTAAPPAPEEFAHKNPPVGPKTGKPLSDWNQFRDYENFNPTPEK